MLDQDELAVSRVAASAIGKLITKGEANDLGRRGLTPPDILRFEVLHHGWLQGTDTYVVNSVWLADKLLAVNEKAVIELIVPRTLLKALRDTRDRQLLNVISLRATTHGADVDFPLLVENYQQMRKYGWC